MSMSFTRKGSGCPLATMGEMNRKSMVGIQSHESKYVAADRPLAALYIFLPTIGRSKRNRPIESVE